MADELDGLLARVDNSALRDDLRTHIDRIRAKRTFGLVSESHLPERHRLPEHPMRAGAKVALRDNTNSAAYQVVRIRDGKATVRKVRHPDGSRLSADEVDAAVGEEVDDAGSWASLQVDFIVVSRRDDGSLAASIVDPHGDHLADAKGKLRARLRRDPRRPLRPHRLHGQVGIMNEFSFLAEVDRAHEHSEDSVALAVHLAGTPCSPLYRRHTFPDSEFQALVATHIAE